MGCVESPSGQAVKRYFGFQNLKKADQNGGPSATRTRDQLVKSQLLYQLS